MASDGKAKIKAMLPTHFASSVHSGSLQNLRILDYTCNTIPNQSDKALIITKCEVVSQTLDNEIKSEVKREEEPAVLSKPIGAALAAIVLKPRQDVKSASQIVGEQRGKTSTWVRKGRGSLCGVNRRDTVRSESPVDYAAESRYLLEEIAKLTAS